MSTDRLHHVSGANAATLPPSVEVISSVSAPPLPDNPDAITLLVTLPPGSKGSAPHRHSGPAFGYVIRGEVIFELEGEPPRVVTAGEAFWEPGGDVIHYQDGNNLQDAESAFVVTLFGAPGQATFTPVNEEELGERQDR
jgi:quercetin dioxygenase-like cupin family protein